jgi:hypothetical protein
MNVKIYLQRCRRLSKSATPFCKTLAMLALIAKSNCCFASWPQIVPVAKAEFYGEASSAKLSQKILAEDGSALYELSCRSGDLGDDLDFNYSGFFQCRLSVVAPSKSESHSLLFEGRTATSDWEGRSRFLLNDVLNSCGRYKDWGATRTFFVRGMRIVFRVSRITLIKEADEFKVKSFVFAYEVQPDKRATSALAESSPVKAPSWFGGGSTCIPSR